jgi:putative acetyltransferase
MSGSDVSGRASTPVSGIEKARPDSEALDMMPTVRLAVDTDADDLVALVGSCFSEYEGCVLETEHEMPHLLRVASHFAAADGRAWVAEADGSVVGSVACRPVRSGVGLELQMLYVMAPWRRLGLGSRFVDLVESETRRRGQSSLELWSDTRFLDAHRLYRSLGFEQLPDVRELHDLSATREYRFRKSL